jgi:hypothetical protein
MLSDALTSLTKMMSPGVCSATRNQNTLKPNSRVNAPTPVQMRYPKSANAMRDSMCRHRIRSTRPVTAMGHPYNAHSDIAEAVLGSTIGTRCDILWVT